MHFGFFVLTTFLGSFYIIVIILALVEASYTEQREIENEEKLQVR